LTQTCCQLQGHAATEHVVLQDMRRLATETRIQLATLQWRQGRSQYPQDRVLARVLCGGLVQGALCALCGALMFALGLGLWLTKRCSVQDPLCALCARTLRSRTLPIKEVRWDLESPNLRQSCAHACIGHPTQQAPAPRAASRPPSAKGGQKRLTSMPAARAALVRASATRRGERGDARRQLVGARGRAPGASRLGPRDRTQHLRRSYGTLGAIKLHREGLRVVSCYQRGVDNARGPRRYAFSSRASLGQRPTGKHLPLSVARFASNCCAYARS